jgi:hypothetical protein
MTVGATVAGSWVAVLVGATVAVDAAVADGAGVLLDSGCVGMAVARADVSVAEAGAAVAVAMIAVAALLIPGRGVAVARGSCDFRVGLGRDGVAVGRAVVAEGRGRAAVGESGSGVAVGLWRAGVELRGVVLAFTCVAAVAVLLGGTRVGLVTTGC